MAARQEVRTRRRDAGHAKIAGTMSQPLLQFDLLAEIERLHSDEGWSGSVGRSSMTLVKHRDLRIVLIAMKAGSVMHEHQAAARISLQTLAGHIAVRVGEERVELAHGHLLTLDQCLPHDVEAQQDSAFLLTLSWPAAAESGERNTPARKKARHARN